SDTGGDLLGLLKRSSPFWLQPRSHPMTDNIRSPEYPRCHHGNLLPDPTKQGGQFALAPFHLLEFFDIYRYL
ncbi:hypothetical protein, partial [Aeromonas veronii]|uniref:hypothetical protein n=1 Tax=Aeromonas veronii TaxID=654 RepID=UPI0035BA5224